MRESRRQLRARHLPASARHGAVPGVGVTSFSSVDLVIIVPHFNQGSLSRQGASWDQRLARFTCRLSISLVFQQELRDGQLSLNPYPYPPSPWFLKKKNLAPLAQVGVHTASLHCLCQRDDC